MILITLKERDTESGNFLKAKTFDKEKLHDLVFKRRRSFFRHPLLGLIRTKTLRIVFDVMQELVELDKQGRYKMHLNK